MLKNKVQTFTNTNLDENHKFIFSHGLSTTDIVCSWIDDNGYDRTTTDIIKINTSTIELQCSSIITGTHKLIMVYDAVISQEGRKLFEIEPVKTEINDGDLRLALGKENANSINIKYSDFTTSLKNSITGDFSLNSDNLSKLSNSQIARDNLDIYSKTATNNYLNLKANISSIHTIVNSQLSKDSSYVPSLSRDIMTKEYTENKMQTLFNSSLPIKSSLLINLPPNNPDSTIIGRANSSKIYLGKDAITRIDRFNISINLIMRPEFCSNLTTNTLYILCNLPELVGIQEIIPLHMNYFYDYVKGGAVETTAPVRQTAWIETNGNVYVVVPNKAVGVSYSIMGNFNL